MTSCALIIYLVAHFDLFAALKKTDISVIMLCVHFQLSPEGHTSCCTPAECIYKVRRRVIIRLSCEMLVTEIN